MAAGEYGDGPFEVNQGREELIIALPPQVGTQQRQTHAGTIRANNSFVSLLATIDDGGDSSSLGTTSLVAMLTCRPSSLQPSSSSVRPNTSSCMGTSIRGCRRYLLPAHDGAISS